MVAGSVGTVLAAEHKGLSSDPQLPHKKPGMSGHAYNPRAGAPRRSRGLLARYS